MVLSCVMILELTSDREVKSDSSEDAAVDANEDKQDSPCTSPSKEHRQKMYHAMADQQASHYLLAVQKERLAIEKRRLDIEKRRLEVEEQRLATEKRRLELDEERAKHQSFMNTF